MIYILCEVQLQKALTHSELVQLGERIKRNVELRGGNNKDEMGQKLISTFPGLRYDEILMR